MADLITIDEYKTFASIGSRIDPKEEAQIAALIKSCSTIVQNFIGYPLNATNSVSEYIQAYEGSTTYMLPGYDLTVSAVKYIPRGTEESNAVDIKPSDYIVRDTGRIELLSITPKSGDSFRVDFTFPTQDMEDIKLATMLLVKHYYKEEFNKTSMAAGGQTVSYQTGKNFPPHVRAILMMHRMF